MSEMFERWRNPDGTFSAIKMLSELSGRTEEETKEIWSTIKGFVEAGGTREQLMQMVNEVRDEMKKKGEK